MDERTRQKPKVVPVFSMERCKRCGICTHACPTRAIEPDSQGVPTLVDADACTSCRLCEHLCPDFAVSMASAEEAARGSDGGEPGDDERGHPPSSPEMCHPFGACDG